MDLNTYWTRLGKTGWLASMPAARKRALKAAVGAALEAGEEGWKGLATGGYDAECIENDGDYTRLLRAYAEASDGRFAPEKVKDSVDIDEGTTRISFTLGGRQYRRTFEQEGDYVADDFDRILNVILEKAGIKERFFQLPADDQIAKLVFVTPEALANAVKAGLVPERMLETDEDDDDDDGEIPRAVDPSGKLRVRLRRADVKRKPKLLRDTVYALFLWEPYEAVTPTQRVVWLAFEYDGEMHHYYLSDPAHTPARVQEALDALEVLGASAHHRLLEEARRMHAAGADERQFDDIDRAYLALDSLTPFIQKYIERNVDEFVVFED
jgi:hypothetical protein